MASSFCYMNRKTIQKVIDELDKEPPRLDYIRGILKTLLENFTEDNKLTASLVAEKYRSPVNESMVKIINDEMDEASILEASARANLSKIDSSQIKTE